MPRARLPLVSIAGVLFACAPSSPTPERGRRDAAAEDGALLDRGVEDLVAPAPDRARPADAPPGIPGSCEASCAQQTLDATFAGVGEPFERAVFAFERDDAQQPLGLYIEALHGGFSGCPAQGSPTPDRTLIVSGLPLPQVRGPFSEADGLRVTLFDYAGTLLPDAPMAKAERASATFVAFSAEPGAEGFVALDLSASFADGVVQGRLYATYCATLE